MIISNNNKLKKTVKMGNYFKKRKMEMLLDWVEVKKDSHEIDDGAWVKCIAEIRNNETSEIREYETDEILIIGEKHPLIFNWEENNYSCDCNRLLFFKRANNENDERDIDHECSEGKFSVNLKNKKDGKVYYREY